MKLIKPSFEILEQEEGLNGVYKQIELAGRTCYKSEDKITEGSAESFVLRMIKSGHGAMLEHGTIYLKVPKELIKFSPYENNWTRLLADKYTKVSCTREDYYYTTNYRVIVEGNYQGVLKYLCQPTEFHEKRITVRFICDRGILAEFTRHRTFSLAAESTRFCNYSKNKFGGELTFIIPNWVNPEKFTKTRIINHDKYGSFISEYYFHLTGENKEFFGSWEITPENNFRAVLQVAEQLYMELLKQGWSPQQARVVLPNALKTELVMTGFISDWKHFFELRIAENAHPQARELSIPLLEEFKKRYNI